jgi:predicted transposase/invertase (TIGR01784 family)
MNNIQFSEDEEVLDIRYDHVFKAVFARDSEASRFALSDLISALIGRAVKVETITANEPTVSFPFDRRMRFDIACKAKTGELVNIEMSFDPGAFVPERFEYHEAKLFICQDIHGKDKYFSDLKEAYQITILSSDLFFPDNELIHTFKYYDEAHGISLNGKTAIVTMELAKAKQVIEKPVCEMSEHEAWAVFFRYLTDFKKRAKINEIVKAKEGISMASESLGTISPAEREYFLRLSEEMYELDVQSRETIARQEGRIEGIAQVAQKMKSMGFSDEQILAATGISDIP